MRFYNKNLLRFLAFAFFATGANAEIDTNSNGVSDVWEREFNNGELFPALVLAADPDLDGWSNLQEAIAGTDPNNPNACRNIADGYYKASFATKHVYAAMDSDER